MKNLTTVVLSLIILGLSTANANGTTPEGAQYLSAHLESFEIGHENLSTFKTGNILIDEVSGRISLYLASDSTCPVDVYCALVWEGEKVSRVIDLPIQRVTTTSCGQKVYVALRDKTPVDGIRERLVVVDSSDRVCPMNDIVATRITYHSFNPWTQGDTFSYFGGKALEAQKYISY